MQADYLNHEDMVKNQIMDAAVHCIQQKGVDKTRIGDIAQQLGLARQTIYNYFATKNELMHATFSRAALSLASATRQHIQPYNKVEDQFTFAMLFAIDAFRADAVLQHVISSGGQFLSEFGISRQTMQAFGSLVLTDVFAQHPFLTPQAGEICEFISRNIVSFLTLPEAGDEPRSHAALEQYIRRRILPGLGLQQAQ